MKHYPSITSLGVMVLGLAGAFVGLVILSWGTTPQSQAFVRSPGFVTWFFINEVLFAAYSVMAVVLWEPVQQLRRHFRSNLPEILGSSAVLFVLFMLPLLSGPVLVKLKPLPFEYAEVKVRIIVTFGFLVSALPTAIGVWLTQAAVRETFGASTSGEQDVNAYMRLRDYLQQFLTALGALLSGFILAIAALRAAALASGATTASDYPSIYLLLLGAYYTALLAIIYFPAHLALAAAGRRLLDTYAALPVPGSEGWSTRYSTRKGLEELLELKLTGSSDFGRASHSWRPL